MPVIAIVNRKGGSGKSTLATHLAAWLAQEGVAVMLGDVDRQQSTKAWLKRRSASLPAISPWALDQKNVLKAPPGVTHVVLDTPGGMQGFELARVVMSADAVVVPVCNSLFDRESAAACLAELSALPRVASGRCQLGVVGMRLDARTKGAETLRQWADDLKLNFLGVLRETQGYVRGLETGITLFDTAGAAQQADLAQWEPILQWLRPIARLQPAVVARPATASQPAAQPGTVHASRAASLMPAQESLVHGSRLSVFAPGIKTESDAVVGVDLNRTLPGQGGVVPQFLLRH
ncbi:MAG: chromosome partitioning protein [Curvibacter sp. RIFCSPHIGHO2_12_FULL_63_18]|uniref:ParA family protein n=1 Tax=Rhodoferax sp. TaxID=50421 RepID=UPI0008B4A9EF|nr:ParA family protein [Rhodoferax sp.]OGO98226.1 MAG: chromosome partitioning protein [Curvibacter sp. GWA2_63_95]OGP06551.1 MAG: chromosome partitioning protein [Curvibacter sp. RIFCSPHIGHO2_12_FULL_63_18]HCX82909.1 chromosome partitioning protein [Rhodoferax sp.]